MISSHALFTRLQALAEPLAIRQKRARQAELKTLTDAPNLWEDQAQAVQLLAELNSLTQLLAQWDELEAFLKMGEEFSATEVEDLERQVQALEQRALLSDKHDLSSAIVTVHAGTGGVDAQDWAEMLMRMFLRYIEQGKTETDAERTLSLNRQDWRAEIIELNRGEEAGIKKAVIEVQGKAAYGLLKSEAGVHRLVRLSPFNAKNLRQTSFALVEVIPEVEAGSAGAIAEKDLRVDVFRASGNGGQGVNTTDSAVRLTHLPTGLVVSVQNERSQHQNKATAMKILQSKLERLQELKNQEETAILKGEFKEGSWGNQIRSYVMQPYQLVKDHRTDQETASVNQVLDGALKPFIEAYLLKQS